MTLYLLTHIQDTACCDADAKPFLEKEQAQKAMRAEWENTLKDWDIEERDKQTDERCWECGEDTASIRDDFRSQFEHWKIEECEIPAKIAILVHNGMVKDVIGNAGVSVEVYDIDVSEFPDPGEAEEADQKAREFEALRKNPDWFDVW